ncbi:MAG: hypothetical protein Q8O88_00715 [bacterium]|nr:hypothetical protein [bacterium]
MNKNQCHDCGANPGEYHKGNCDVERCPGCGDQILGCGLECQPENKRDEIWGKRKVWDGLWPGTVECIEYNFWCYWGKGWEKCAKEHPEARPDFNTLYTRCRWDIDKQQFVLKI